MLKRLWDLQQEIQAVKI
ncbi:hypothetical protein S40285_10838 [Stachybotrys chlorohalonatus IBT 40285]|uniref:Uncharacterized protein n=1 Tax=Stachybotrys chlorohalonatus (strain IBT 40285) TaxID=1283841 RepID=A0A084QYP1_STAC4|nr:hypothetical protein S40285_10838 [Stachybotrys chlorohalonata IBT 40285]